MTLPTVDGPFVWRERGGRAGLVCAPLEPFADHVFTTADWALGTRMTGAAAGRPDPWEEVSAALALPTPRLVRATQVHGSTVIVGTAANAGGVLPPADVILLREPDAAAAVQVADCVPMLAVDRRTGAVAAVHAGWRGLAARVPAAAVASLAHVFAARAADVLVALGPSIGACCYEVGADVREAFVAAGFAPEALRRWFVDRPKPVDGNPPLPRVAGQAPREGRWFFDGWLAARDQLVAAGVPEGQVYSAGVCTASHPGVFCSYRRDGAPAGRLAAAIRCRPRP